MHTASREWAAVVAARNEVETAKAQKRWQPEFLFSGAAQLEYDGGRAAAGVPLSAAAKEAGR